MGLPCLNLPPNPDNISCKLLSFSCSKFFDVGNFDCADNCRVKYASKQYNSCITYVLQLTYCSSDHTKEKKKAPSLCNFSEPLLGCEQPNTRVHLGCFDRQRQRPGLFKSHQFEELCSLYYQLVDWQLTQHYNLRINSN